MIYVMFVKNCVNIVHTFFYDLVVISSAIWIVDVSVFYEKTERDKKDTEKDNNRIESVIHVYFLQSNFARLLKNFCGKTNHLQL